MSIATKCTCGHSLTGVCSSSVKECRQLKKENTQLLVEVFKRGDYVQTEGETAIILVTGWTNTDENFRGVVVEAPIDGPFPLRLGEYSETWHTKKFRKTAYASKLQEVEQENIQLNRWKAAQIALFEPLYDYGMASKEIRLGESIVTFILNRCKEYDKLKQQATGWRPLLEKVLREDAVRGTISTPTIEKITKFLYGE